MPGFDALRAALGPDGEPLSTGRWAAVLILLGEDPEPTVLLTERAGTLNSHAGQISFPGGAIEPGESPIEAALREAREEVGLESATVLGCLPRSSIPGGFDVTPVVASWRARPLAPVDAGEVAKVATIELARLANPAARVTATLPRGYRGPAFLAGDWFVWGLTAHLIDLTLRLGGWERPWDRSIEVSVPERFR